MQIILTHIVFHIPLDSAKEVLEAEYRKEMCSINYLFHRKRIALNLDIQVFVTFYSCCGSNHAPRDIQMLFKQDNE